MLVPLDSDPLQPLIVLIHIFDHELQHYTPIRSWQQYPWRHFLCYIYIYAAKRQSPNGSIDFSVSPSRLNLHLEDLTVEITQPPDIIHMKHSLTKLYSSPSQLEVAATISLRSDIMDFSV